jgi:hypothetical protein
MKRSDKYTDRINDKSGFKDPDAIKYQRPKDKPHNAVNSPWDFRCPQYDQRTSNFINAGTHYGLGINQPVGHSGAPKQHVDVLPMGINVKTMRDDEKG